MFTLEATPLTGDAVVDWARLAKARAARIDASLAPAFTAIGTAQSNLDQLLGGALCVSTGQQPGLFGGPLFTLFKALSVVERARQASAALGRPVVPVFWVAGDDHDFAEANHCVVLNATGEPERIELRARGAAAPSTPLYREVLGPEISVAIDRVAAAVPEGESRGPIIDWLRSFYAADATFASAFAGLLADLLAPHGLIVFQASHPAAKRAMQPWLDKALGDSGAIDQALVGRARELAAADQPVPVQVGDGATLVMVEGTLGRDRLVRTGDGFATRRSGESWPADALRAELSSRPERFSPNVLLRPVVEAALLPTLAYVGGPGELAYLEQADPVYQQLGVAPQARVARWSGRVIEPRVARLLEKQGMTADQLEREGAQLERELLRDEIPADARAALQVIRETIDREFPKVIGAATGIDPTLQKPVESARNSALAGLADVEKRMIGHLKKKNDIATSQVSRARNSLFPLGQPQERLISSVSFLGRFGSAFVDQVAEAIRAP